jgi:hypothetical protein
MGSISGIIKTREGVYMKDFGSVPSARNWPTDPSELERFNFENGNKVVRHEQKPVNNNKKRTIIKIAIASAITLLAAVITLPKVVDYITNQNRKQIEATADDIAENANFVNITEDTKKAEVIDFYKRLIAQGNEKLKELAKEEENINIQKAEANESIDQATESLEELTHGRIN